ncbi:MAG: SoxR reducing system RseC family protein [Bacteroidales bacterium]|nr:SoxR reducing system RseC family protein [Bacteroidales bacterium]
MLKKNVTGTIRHFGRVQSVNSDSLVVKIIPESACAGCHAKGHCSLSGDTDKTVVLKGRYNVAKDDTVIVEMQEKMGFTALIYGYLIPFAVLVLALVVLTLISVPEITAALLSLSALAVYFVILYFFRNSLEKKFTFTLKT